MGKKKKAIYAGIILTPKSQMLAKGWALGYNELKGLMDKVFAHHMTLCFKPSKEYMADLPIGEEVVLTITSVGRDEGCIAVGVSSDHPAMELCTNENPHITICCAEGVSPVHSNELTFRPLENPKVQLEGRVGFFNGKEDRFDFEGSIYED